MPSPVSKKQFRYMMAILHGKSGTSSRGDRVPKSVAGKYAGKGTGGGTESKGKEYEGGKWTGSHHEKAKSGVDKERIERKKKKAKLKKALEQYIIENKRQGAGCLCVDSDGKLLLGRRTDNGMWATPGGHVDPGEDFQEAALRELREEANLVGRDPEEIAAGHYRGYDSKTYLVQSFRGKLKSNGEMSALKWFDPHELPWTEMTDYCRDAVVAAVKQQLTKNKSLKYLMAEEELQKNIIRSGSSPHNTIYEVTHGDALRLVGNGTFRMLREMVKDMGDEEHREAAFDTYTVHIRKHVSDVYSGRIVDGHKQIHQWTNKSLPAVAAELMSVFEWYLPEDEKELEIIDDIGDDVIEGGLNELIDKYRKHNIVNIYHEMENIREEMRHDMAVDLQQVEQKIMRLFDKLESVVMDIADKHNMLNSDSGDAIDMLENKLVELQTRIESLSTKPTSVEAYSPAPGNEGQIHDNYYPYLSRPSVVISPDGRIKISFDADWTSYERENFLKDMKAKVIKKSSK